MKEPIGGQEWIGYGGRLKSPHAQIDFLDVLVVPFLKDMVTEIWMSQNW